MIYLKIINYVRANYYNIFRSIKITKKESFLFQKLTPKLKDIELIVMNLIA